MEIVGSVFGQFLECISAPIAERWKYHRRINENLVTLKKRLEELNCRKRDIEARMNTELMPGATMLKNEVELWLARVEAINVEIKAIEEKVERVKFFSRASFGRNVVMKTEEVQDLWKTGDTSTKFGVYGMGGIGKTTALEHINNRILESKDKFDSVIWVTVSKDSDLMNLQDKIAYKLGVHISKADDDKITRAAKLREKFETKKRFVLILDDLWEAHSLKEVGIPEPTLQNGCRLILTTRSVEVCHRMSCEQIRIELLSDDDALNLFLDTVGRHVLSIQNLAVIVKEIIQECAGLPLAVVTIAGSLKESKILQDSLLYCALYPEDHEIGRDFLIEHLIAEGIIKEKNTRQNAIRKAQVVLNKLVNACLLNDALRYGDEKCVKMHDLIRDMAIQITSESPRFFVKAGVRLKSIPDEENWSDVSKASFMDTDIVDIPSSIEPPKCPNLSTLFLSNNHHLKSMSDNFFLHMKSLNVLKLSGNYNLENLPESVSNLVCLTALFLRGCGKLRFVPSLAKLTDLRELDLRGSGINEVPHGMEMLVKLRCLGFYARNLKMIPDGILCNLTNLQYLSLNRHLGAPKVREKELENLRKLESFGGVLYDINSFNEYVRSLHHRRLTRYVLQLGFIKNSWWHPVGKLVYLINCDISETVAASAGGYPRLIPNDVEFLGIQSCSIGVTNLCELASFENVTNLRECHIVSCEIEHVFSYSPGIFPLLQNLESLVLGSLSNLRGLILRQRGAPSSPLPAGTFSSLKSLRLSFCDKVKKISMMASLPKLEELDIYNCKELKEIISTTSDDDDDEDRNEEEGSDHHAMKIVTLPNLRKVSVCKLPKLCSLPLVADSLQEISLEDLPKLKRVPLLDRDPCPSSLQRVNIHQYLWESSEWDHANAKDVIQSLRERQTMSHWI
ncbi:NB-ARC domain, LRR domain containing protein [Trema orientale]|uniref:NB-ARC domain, LRR domain containing protein n=1 Tax=Trema orientale TaxID=63057 RepID=A0A2P5D598_TREOI|nr:NB-ARC domain, LRR domain containing protein [Trema orientale]